MPGQFRISGLLIDLGHGIRQAAAQKQQEQSPFAAGLPRPGLIVDQQDGANGQKEADGLGDPRDFSEEAHRDHHGHQQAQLHKGGGQHNAVLLNIDLQKHEGAQEQDAVDDTQQYRRPQPGLRREQLPEACIAPGQCNADQVIDAEHADIVFDLRLADTHKNGYKRAAEHSQK